jgi:hypothetical protein
VQPLKLEDTGTGGNQTDQFPRSIDPQHDYVECAGIVLDDGSNRDETAVIDRSSNDMRFKDGNNPTFLTLSALVEQGSAKFSASSVAGGAGWTVLGTLSVSTNAAATFEATFMGRDKTTGDTCGWILKGAAKRATGSVTILSLEKEVLYADDSSWDVRASGVGTGITFDIYPDGTNATEWICLLKATNIGGADSVGYTGFSRVGNYASIGSAGINGRQYTALDSPTSQWRDDGTNWRPIVGNTVGTKPPLASSWTAFNSGSVSDVNGTIYSYHAVESPAPMRGAAISASGATLYVSSIIRLNVYDTGASTNACAGICIRNSSTGKAACLVIGSYSPSGTDGKETQYLNISRWTNANTIHSGYDCDHKWYGSFHDSFALRLRISSGTIYPEYSFDLSTWYRLRPSVTLLVSDVFGSDTPDQVGLYLIAASTLSIYVPHFQYGTL